MAALPRSTVGDGWSEVDRGKWDDIVGFNVPLDIL